MNKEITYVPKGLFKNRHINTCFPSLFRRVSVTYTRERLELSDGDFLDIDTIKNGNSRALVLCHGLEGSSKSKYIQGMAKYFSQKGWDIFAINYRGCSGSMNRKPFFYHSALIKDLDEVLIKTESYNQVLLSGFSLGANLILRYLALIEKLPHNLKGAAVISPPCDLKSSTEKMLKKENFIYTEFFLRKLRKKIIHKHKIFPKEIPLNEVLKAKNLYDFDNCFTAKLAGFKNADEYYEKSSSKPHLHKITLPTLIVTPLDDPIMGEKCYPYKEAKENSNITFETPQYGGHIGFSSLKDFPYWQEERIFSFFNFIEKNLS